MLLECANFLDLRGHEVHVYASDWDAERLNEGIVKHHVPVRMNPAVWHIPAFAQMSRIMIRAQQPRVDVLGSFGAHSPPGGVMWVQSVHREWLYISGMRRSFRSRFRQRCNLFHPMILAFERHYFGGRRYGKLVALSERVKQELMRWYNVPEKDIVIIPNGFAPAEFNISRCAGLRETMRTNLGYGDGDKVIVLVANELERKGFGPLMRAIAMLKNPDLKLLVVGRVTGDAYHEEMSRLGMSDRVRFAGPSSDVAAYYAAADVFALPTQYEAWGLVIIEAMACGLPALTSKLAGAAVAIQPGENGDLLDDPDNAEEIAARLKPLINGRHVTPTDISSGVQQYTWSQVLLNYEATLRELRRR